MPLGFFQEEDARRIARHVKQNENRSAVRRNRPRRRALQPFRRITIQIPDGGLPAADNYKMTGVECKVLQAVPDDSPGAAVIFKDTGRTEKVYNWGHEVIGSTGLRLGKAGFEDGIYQISAADCEDERTFVAPESI